MNYAKAPLAAVFLSAIILSCTPNSLRKIDNKLKYTDSKTVLGLNAINADNSYYTKAIIDYLLLERVLTGYSSKYFGTPEDAPEGAPHVQKLVLFPQLQNFYKPQSSLDTVTLRKLKQAGVKHCTYDIPHKLKDLKSGFQFNHYVFKGSNRAALQAFGIVNSDVKSTCLYIITDYIQFQDIKCSSIPKIRYAVGMRAEFKILDIESESKLSGIGSLAGLAAQVETKNMQVNITIKTIGITGLNSRLSIPENTTFDVKTYSSYEKVLDFIRKLDDSNTGSIIIQPQIIPVMDEYRTSIDYSLYPTLESVELLETKLKEYKKQYKKDYSGVEKLENDIQSLKLNLIKEEINSLRVKRVELIANNTEINNYKNIIGLFMILNENPELLKAYNTLEKYLKEPSHEELLINNKLLFEQKKDSLKKVGK